jgi:hypothetical protein
VELVERGAAAKSERLGDLALREQLDESARLRTPSGGEEFIPSSAGGR